MPLDVLLGYIYFDSLARTCTQSDLDSVIGQLNYGDTLRYALRYLYIMQDFDPLVFFQFCYAHPAGYRFKSLPSGIVKDLVERAMVVSPDHYVSPSLCATELILHLSVTDTSSAIDSSLPDGMNRTMVVTASVIDTIKGSVLPTCTMAYPYSSGRRPVDWSTKSVLSPNCFQFEYALFWQKDIRNGSFRYNYNTQYDTAGNSYVKKGGEYIVLLRFQNLGIDSSVSYFSCYPGMHHSSCMSIYAISEGHVLDPQNDFGFGTRTTLADFESNLKSKINGILMK